MNLLCRLSQIWSEVTGEKEQKERKRQEFESAYLSAEEYLFLLSCISTSADVRCCWSGDDEILCDEASKLCEEADFLNTRLSNRLREIKRNIEKTEAYPDDPWILFEEELQGVKMMIGRLRPYADAETFKSDIAIYHFIVSTIADPSLIIRNG